jgi:hypothetical protein
MMGDEWMEPKAPQGEALMECPAVLQKPPKPVPEGTKSLYLR